MPSKTFEEILNSQSAEDKAKLEQTRNQITNAQEANSTEITQHSTPNDTALDAHRTTAPAAEKGNSATVSEISDKPATQEKQPPVQEQDRDR